MLCTALLSQGHKHNFQTPGYHGCETELTSLDGAFHGARHEEIYFIVVGEVFADVCALGFAVGGEEGVADAFAVPGCVVKAFAVADEVEDWWH